VPVKARVGEGSGMSFTGGRVLPMQPTVSPTSSTPNEDTRDVIDAI
jgi:hypothetical protein